MIAHLLRRARCEARRYGAVLADTEQLLASLGYELAALDADINGDLNAA